MRYHWQDRHDDLINRSNPWPVRIEFALLAILSLLALSGPVIKAVRWLLSFAS